MDGVREVSGIRARLASSNDQRVTIMLYEQQTALLINLSVSTSSDAALTPDDARRLARCLYRAARRVETRSVLALIGVGDGAKT